MNKELMEALDILEKEKEISKETLFEAIENSLITAGRIANQRVLILTIFRIGTSKLHGVTAVD